MKLNALRDKRNQKAKEAREMLDKAAAENRELNEAEAKKYDEIMQEIDALNANIKRAEKLETVEATLEQPDATATPGLTRTQAPEAKKEFSSLGEFMYAVARNPSDPRLNYIEFEKKADQTMGTGSEGGFAVPTQFGNTLLQVPPQEAVIEGRCLTIPAGSPPDAAITFPALDQTGDVPDNVYGGVTVDWIGEGGEKPSTQAALRQVTLEPKEVAGHIPVTDKLLRNWLAAGTVLQTLLRGALLSARERAFFNGNGAGKPLGFVNSGAAKTVGRNEANKIKYVDIVNMLARLLMRGGQPYWLASQSILAQLATLKDDAGNLIWVANGRDGIAGFLMGYPLFWYERSPNLGTKGDLCLLNTNPYYMIKQGSGPFVGSGFINDDFVKNKSRIKVFQLVDGQPWLTAPFKQEGGYEVSPFVILNVPG